MEETGPEASQLWSPTETSQPPLRSPCVPPKLLDKPPRAASMLAGLSTLRA